jgi:mono/diheme cytochrome c family protein
MKMKRNFVMLLVMAIAGMATMSFVVSQDQKKGGPWNVPAEYKSKKNPNSGQADLLPVGKMLWAKHCKSCHGNMGLGDGPKAASLKTNPGNFKDAAFQAQSDGVIYYQSFVGRDEMPNFEKKIPEDEDRWALVNFIRTMK